ncbi:MAG TPA: hypothetical protein DEP05_07580 [Betaproteobacteria bacterium]|nr:hypothetical protein [Betaproteobacteria bacterium]
MTTSANAVPVLMYHHVTPHPGLVTVSPRAFQVQMTSLARRGYTTLSADRFFDFLHHGRDVPAKSVLITFDDGYLDNYVHAYPVLRELGLRATLFAVTGWIGNGPARPFGERDGAPHCPNHRACKAAIADGRADEAMLRWTEIETMEASGAVEIHCHTHTHTRWDKTLADPIARRTALARDLTRSKEALRQRLGREERHLCWPQGYFDDDYVAVAQQLGFEALYTTRKHVNTRRTPPTDIGRIVTKERNGDWLLRRLSLYSSPLLGRLYTALRGE